MEGRTWPPVEPMAHVVVAEHGRQIGRLTAVGGEARLLLLLLVIARTNLGFERME